MDALTQKAVTQALDTAISTVAEEWFEKLSHRMTEQEIAEKVCKTLRSLERLQRGEMPQYDAWDALFYALWYQPSQINLAYTLARNIPESLNPLISGIGHLEVFDFGRGALAMNFGLSLASSDFARKTPPRIFVAGGDASESMQQIGWEIWDCFIEEMCEVKDYPELRSLRRTCFNMKVERKGTAPTARWLTILHVAYEENFDEVGQNLSDQIKLQKPDLIIATTHKVSEGWLYCPDLSLYEQNDSLSADIEATDLMFKGKFEKTTLFRKNLWHAKINTSDNHLSNEEKSFVKNYLTSLDTTWTAATKTKQFSAACRAYVRS